MTVPKHIVSIRVKLLGWSPERAATTPVRSAALDIDDFTLPTSAWATVSPVSRTTIQRRLLRGWSPVDAVFREGRIYRRKAR